jgi:hypothetical protein
VPINPTPTADDNSAAAAHKQRWRLPGFGRLQALRSLQSSGDILPGARKTLAKYPCVVSGFCRASKQLTRAGITFQRNEQLEIFDTRTGKVDLVHAPDEIRFEVDSFNRRVITQAFNRVIAEELVRHIDPSLPGKTLVFASTDGHADILVNEIKNAMHLNVLRVMPSRGAWQGGGGG